MCPFSLILEEHTMITGIACFVGGLFFQKFYPFFGDIIVSKVQAGFTAAKAMFNKAPQDPKQ